MTRLFLAAWFSLFVLWAVSTYWLLVQNEQLHGAHLLVEGRVSKLERAQLGAASRAWIAERMRQESEAREAAARGYLPPLSGMTGMHR